jgi:protein TonB
VSQLGSLSHCIVESDPESRARAKWLRGKSLALSLALEAAVLAVLLLFPLLGAGVLPPVFTVTPALPYRGEPGPVRQAQRVTSHGPADLFNPVSNRPVLRPAHNSSNAAPPAISEPLGPIGTVPGITNGEGRGEIVPLASPQTPPRAKPLPQSEGVMAARLIRCVQPEYPRIAQLMRLSGVVRLRAIIGTDGSVRQLQVLSGNLILAQAAAAAVRQWRYEPTRLNGQPVEVETSITVTFTLNAE